MKHLRQKKMTILKEIGTEIKWEVLIDEPFALSSLNGYLINLCWPLPFDFSAAVAVPEGSSAESRAGVCLRSAGTWGAAVPRWDARVPCCSLLPKLWNQMPWLWRKENGLHFPHHSEGVWFTAQVPQLDLNLISSCWLLSILIYLFFPLLKVTPSRWVTRGGFSPCLGLCECSNQRRVPGDGEALRGRHGANR